MHLSVTEGRRAGRTRSERLPPWKAPSSEQAPRRPPPGGDASTPRGTLLLTKSDIRRLLGLATDVESSERVVTALYHATRGDSHRAKELLRAPGTGDRADASAAAHLFRREGDYWTIAHEGRVVRLRDTKGLRYLASLLRQPGHPIPVTELAGRDAATADRAGLERVRLAVTKAVKAALERINAEHPELGRHLAATVRRGYVCLYLPDPPSGIRWTE